MTVTRGPLRQFHIFSFELMLSCWAVRPKDRPSFKDVLQSITRLLNPCDNDGFNTIGTRRPETNESTREPLGIESRMVEETSFANVGEDGSRTHIGNEDNEGPGIEYASLNTPEYLVLVESPMLQSRWWIIDNMWISLTENGQKPREWAWFPGCSITSDTQAPW